MIKTIRKIIPAVAALIIGGISAFAFNAEAEASDVNKKQIEGWNTAVTETEVVTGSAFTYNAYVSEDNKRAWIYNIEVDEKTDSSNLVIPAAINGKTVTKLGWVNVPRITADDYFDEGFNRTIFGSWVEQCHGCPGYCREASGIKYMTIPDTVTELQETAFSGMSNLGKVTIPDGVKDIPAELFYGCDKLKSVKLPESMESFAPSALTDCPKLNKITLSRKCTNYSVNGKCLVYNKDKAVVFCFATGKKYNIPKGIKKINMYSFTNCIIKTVHIPASVNLIEGAAFHRSNGYSSRNIQNITISPKNKVYAKDGQTIFNKKDKSLTIAVIKWKNNKSKYVMSDKVKVLKNYSQSTINMDEYEEHIDKLYVSKNLKRVEEYGWGVVQNSSNVYFTGKKVPKVSKKDPSYANLPIFTHIHVPKAADKQYKKLYRDNKMDDYVDKWSVY